MKKKKIVNVLFIVLYVALILLGFVICFKSVKDCCCIMFGNGLHCPCDYDKVYQIIKKIFLDNSVGLIIYFIFVVVVFGVNMFNIIKSDRKKKKLRGIFLGLSLVVLFYSFYYFWFDYEPVLNSQWDKPILYLYPEEETEVTVNFEHEDRLLTTYPKFKDEWEVIAYPNGDLYSEDKYYYALYWDEKSTGGFDFSTGFYVESDEAIEFLEEKLTYIGLNDRERNEFIMYWLPILENNGKSLVHFNLTEDRQKENKLIIEPTPDSLLRVEILIKKVSDKVEIKEQKLTTFNRIGFSAVEWGGTIVD